MPSAFSWPLVVPSALAGSGAGYLGSYASSKPPKSQSQTSDTSPACVELIAHLSSQKFSSNFRQYLASQLGTSPAIQCIAAQPQKAGRVKNSLISAFRRNDFEVTERAINEAAIASKSIEKTCLLWLIARKLPPTWTAKTLTVNSAMQEYTGYLTEESSTIELHPRLRSNCRFNVDANSGHAFGILLAAVGTLRPCGLRRQLTSSLGPV
jgi:hypothetical protein